MIERRGLESLAVLHVLHVLQVLRGITPLALRAVPTEIAA